MLHIRFFGTPVFMVGDRPLTALTRSPILTNLFAFLVTYRVRPHSRSVLAAMFWPNVPESQARRNLNSHLWRLRRMLDVPAAQPSYFLSDEQTIQLNPATPYWLDVAEFEAATAVLLQSPHDDAGLAAETVSRLEYAVDLYCGDFLEGVYADWCLGPRERLREQYLLALETLLRAHLAMGQLEAALRHAQSLAQADPLHEDAHFQLIQLYARLGRQHEARAQYRRYETLWLDELQLDPSPRMKALIRGNYLAALAKLEQALSLTTLETASLVRVMIGGPSG